MSDAPIKLHTPHIAHCGDCQRGDPSEPKKLCVVFPIKGVRRTFCLVCIGEWASRAMPS